MNDKEFLLDLKDYIEQAEERIDGECGDNRNIELLIEQEEMPDVYWQVLDRLAQLTGEPRPKERELTPAQWPKYKKLETSPAGDHWYVAFPTVLTGGRAIRATGETKEAAYQALQKEMEAAGIEGAYIDKNGYLRTRPCTGPKMF